MLENDRPADALTVRHIDRCLSCLSCMTTCPSGVNYMHLVDHARAHIERTFARPLPERWLRRLLALVLPRPALFRAALLAAMAARPLARLLPGRLGAMAGMAPGRLPPPSPVDRPQTFPAEGKRRLRVALLTGCAQTVLAPAINEATVRLLTRFGAEVVVAEGAGCCGALVHHMGLAEAGRRAAAANVRAWLRARPDRIVVNASGCGTQVKDYGYMLRGAAALAENAAWASARTRDLTELLDELGFAERAGGAAPKLRIAYHSACSMQHGQKITGLPMRLLEAAGFEPVSVPEGHICCGSAGAYNLLQPELAGRLGRRKGRLYRKHAPGRRRRRQYRLHGPDRRRYGPPRAPHRPAPRLGNGRAETGGGAGPAVKSRNGPGCSPLLRACPAFVPAYWMSSTQGWDEPVRVLRTNGLVF